MWSRKFECCMVCGKSDAKHMGKGLCHRCYFKQYGRKNRKHLADYKHAWYMQDREKHLIERRAYREEKHFEGKRGVALARDGCQCQKCGSADNLVVHHEDRNGRGSAVINNCLDNLMTLCRACHILVHYEELYAKRALNETPKLNKHGKWNEKFAACVSCGATFSRYAAKGLCSRCYQRKKSVDKMT